jgi:hypothetical protein
MNNDVYVSTDGSTFNADGLDAPEWWLSVVTTPADPDRIYVTGYHPADPDKALLRVKKTSGGGWQNLDTSMADVTFGEARPFFYILGVSPTDADVVFGRAAAVNPPIGDALYRSIDGGTNWTKVLDMAGQINAFTIRSDGQTVIVGTSVPCAGEATDADKGCVRVSNTPIGTPPGAAGSWTVPATEPRMGCLGERSDGTLFACGSNYAPDFFGIGRSTDGQSWDPVFVFNDFEDLTHDSPMQCPADSIQGQTCVPTRWPLVACGTLMLDLALCASGGDAGPGPGGRGVAGGGTCRAGGDGSGAGVSSIPAVLTALALLWWSRRRRRSRKAPAGRAAARRRSMR